jgi:hypothetical protein
MAIRYYRVPGAVGSVCDGELPLLDAMLPPVMSCDMIETTSAGNSKVFPFRDSLLVSEESRISGSKVGSEECFLA